VAVDVGDNSLATKFSQSPVVTEVEYILPGTYGVKAFGITTIISRVLPPASALSMTAGRLTKCGFTPHQLIDVVGEAVEHVHHRIALIAGGAVCWEAG